MPVLTPELRTEAERIKARYPRGRERSAILPLLYLMQSEEGHVSREGLREVADLLGTTTAEVEAVATFYTMLRLRPTGRHLVNVCTNLSCTLRGAREVYEAAHRATGIPHGGELSDDGIFSVHEEECLGACDAAPVVQIDFANHDRVTTERMTGLIEELRGGAVPAPSRGSAPADFRDASRILAGVATAAGRAAADAPKESPETPAPTSVSQQAEPTGGPDTQQARGAGPSELRTGERPS